MQYRGIDRKLKRASVGVAVFEGPDLILRSANDAYLRMVCRTTSTVGTAWSAIFPELVGTPVHDDFQLAWSGGRVERQDMPVSLLRSGELTERFYTFTLDPTYDDDGVLDGVVFASFDVTKLVVTRREAQARAEQMQARETSFRALFDALDEGVCLVEMMEGEAGQYVDYRYLEANEAFTRQTGLADPIGKTATALVPGLDVSWVERYGRVLTTGTVTRFQDDVPSLGRSFEVFASRVGGKEQRQVGVVFKDVSEQLRLEAREREMLEAEQAARRLAEDVSRLKDEFLLTVSHELRTPLTSMLGWLSLLRSDRVPANRIAHGLEIVQRNAKAQAQIVEDLLDASNMLEGKLRLDISVLELRAIVESSLETLRPAAAARDVRLEWAYECAGTVRGDARRLHQIVWNLLSNAVKFTSKGGRVHVALRPLESSVELTVRDTGIGLSPELVRGAFDRFRQADGSTTRIAGGLGLGLSIVRGLVELHGGTVEACSEGVGLGSTFAVRLPAALAGMGERVSTIPAALSPTVACPPELEGLSVVAMGTNEDSREITRHLLESCGATVRVAASVEEALELLGDSPADMLVADVDELDASGFELIERVRAHEARAGRAEVPAIALTADARTELRARCLRAGFDGHVPKPLEPLELLAVIASLSKRRGRPEA